MLSRAVSKSDLRSSIFLLEPYRALFKPGAYQKKAICAVYFFYSGNAWRLSKSDLRISHFLFLPCRMLIKEGDLRSSLFSSKLCQEQVASNDLRRSLFDMDPYDDTSKTMTCADQILCARPWQRPGCTWLAAPPAPFFCSCCSWLRLAGSAPPASASERTEPNLRDLLHLVLLLFLLILLCPASLLRLSLPSCSS